MQLQRDYDKLYSWLTPTGKFLPVRGKDEHLDVLKHLRIDGGFDEAFKRGYVRVASLGKIIVVEIKGNEISKLQRRKLIDLAIVTKRKAIRQDTSSGWKTLWSNPDFENPVLENKTEADLIWEAYQP